MAALRSLTVPLSQQGGLLGWADMRPISLAVILLWTWPVLCAERVFDFGATRPGDAPPGFRSVVAGNGSLGEWKIVLDDAPGLVAPLTAKSVPDKQPVLGQLSRDRTDERFPMFIVDDEVFGDFKFTTRFKLVSGDVEQMAGIVFRLQDEKNYYYIRASGLGNTFYFYVVTDGRRSAPIGNKMEIARGVWHELTVECRGNEIRAFLNSRPALPPLQDSTFGSGKVGFWTKSDAVTYYTDARMTYTPRQSLAQILVREAMAKYPRLLGLNVIAETTNASPVIIASSDPAEVGKPVEKEVLSTIGQGTIYYGKSARTVAVTLPLRDSNGENVGAVRVTMKPFPGQTEKNAIARATPVARLMENRMGNGRDLTQ
jgi:hypothetical protein